MFWLVLAGFLPIAQATLFLTPPNKQWVREGQEDVKLLCKASEKIRACSWNTPYGKGYPLSTGLKAEGGRLVHFGNDNKTECGILITKIERKDEGRWTCNVGVVEGEEVKSASGMANVTIAVAPDDVFLAKPFDKKNANVTAGVEQFVTCTAKNAKPAPTFTWTIDGTPLQLKTTDEEVYIDVAGLSTFSQTLHLTPTLQDGNKSLSCSISHPGLDQAVGVHVNLRVTGSGLSLEMGGLPVGAIIGIVIAAIFALTIVILLALLYRGKCCGKADHEKLADELAADENEAEVDPEKAETSAVEVQPKEKKGFNVMFVSALARLRPSARHSSANKADETLASEFEKVDLTAVAEESDEKADTPKEVVVAVDPEQPKLTLSKKVRGFFTTKFGPKAKKDDVEMEEKEREEEKEEEKKEDSEEKMEELEPEDKEEKEVVDNKAVEEKRKAGSETPV